MDVEFSFPLKFYHAYLENIYAPQGLNASSRHLEKIKWRRFGPEAQMQFTVRREGNYTIVKVTRNGQALDYALVNSNEGRKLIQFCAKKPSISCKYMISSTHMRRFQVAFDNDSDFSDATNKIIGLGLIVVRAHMPPVISQSAAPPQCSSQTPLQSMLSLLNQRATNDNAFPQSQLVPDMSMNVWEELGPLTRTDAIFTSTREPDSNLVQLQESSSLEKMVSEEGVSGFPRFNDPIAAPSITTGNCLAVNPAIEILASQPYVKSTIENKGPKDPPSPPLEDRITLPKGLIKLAPAPLPILPTAPAPLVQFQVPQSPESAPHASATHSQIPIPASEPHSVHPLASAAISPPNQEQNNETNGKLKKTEDNNTNATLPELKISKKLIKRKLKDKKFLKWVSKVESVLSEMVEKTS
ncbi:ZYRO0A08646p [Zygosaccharomyces rouxii]|uniref:ZYRO0A08646p n=1 Tax=Zygosaccharomyces rouxii (strain ATCC 2623 / CBS 732 / NBRC 1130 / NCYC 568 / NRRL Y-229) TaxID=559307 RepID=C5DQ50_ZYGRC|nr:uncharacterized protein ZYRO0A08646g [Zygosaccharomyces rouxii]KAH9198670.1 hypothetical protein LQ764DRAFT_211077 [Zygosaccharomyces rouxii]CAR25811.1 ZYRO0A08646p [Zygosaccharomyces rouxii]